MNILRNILTAIWCALIAGWYGFLALNLSFAKIETVWPYLLLLGAPAVFALLALIYVPALILSVVAQFVLLVVVLGFGAGPGASVFQISVLFVIAIISGLLVAWDIAYRRNEKLKNVIDSEVFE